MDEDVLFLRPDESMASEIAAYRQEFLDSGDSMDGAGPLRRARTPLEWLFATRLYEREDTVPVKGHVKATQCVLWRREDKKLLGMLQIRHELNDFLRVYAGHIGYSVRPSERRRGYAKRMLREALAVCRDMGLAKVMICCYTDNEGSRRTILDGGGVYESTVFEPSSGHFTERYWITLGK